MPSLSQSGASGSICCPQPGQIVKGSSATAPSLPRPYSSATIRATRCRDPLVLEDGEPADPARSAMFSVWGPLLEGTPELAHEAFHWEAG
jgi:hypothetical protein